MKCISCWGVDHLITPGNVGQYVGEESSFLKTADQLTDEPTWFIDPLDGTTNFVHGYPFVCVSIGLMVNKVISRCG